MLFVITLYDPQGKPFSFVTNSSERADDVLRSLLETQTPGERIVYAEFHAADDEG